MDRLSIQNFLEKESLDTLEFVGKRYGYLYGRYTIVMAAAGIYGVYELLNRLVVSDRGEEKLEKLSKEISKIKEVVGLEESAERVEKKLSILTRMNELEHNFTDFITSQQKMMKRVPVRSLSSSQTTEADIKRKRDFNQQRLIQDEALKMQWQRIKG